MRESKKDKRDHMYGRIHRKDRQLHDEMKKARTLQWREFLKKNGIDVKKKQKPTQEQIYEFITTVGYPHDGMQAINEFWEECGLDWQKDHEEFCRFLRYHGHSNRGWIHADFIKRRDKEFEKLDRMDAMEEE